MNIVDENYVEMEPDHRSELIEGEHTSPNTQNNRRFLKKCYGKNCYGLIVIIIIFVIAAAVGIVIWNAFDSSNPETEANTQKSKVVDRVTSCLFHDMSDKNVDPFIDTCKFGSRKVKKKCNESPQSCKDCCQDCEKLLPIVCFCDELLHCPDKNSDRPAKMEYNKCLDYCPCQNGGNCSKDPEVSLATAKDIKCSCPEGFRGHYCQHIPIRICEEQLSTSMLQTKNCSRNYDAKCHISQNNSTFICKIPQHQSETHNIPNCTNG